MNISTNGIEIARFAGALYNLAIDNTTEREVLDTANTNGGLSGLLNSVFSRDFPSASAAQIAAIMSTNLGLTGAAATGAQAYITGALGGVARSSWGSSISGMLDLFASLTSDATFGAAATAWEARVGNSVAYSNNAANTSMAMFSNLSSAAPGMTFTLTASIDSGAAFTGSTGNDAFNATASTFSALDTLVGGGGTDTLSIIDIGPINTTTVAGVSVTGIANVVIASGAAIITANTTGWTGTTSLTAANGSGGQTLTAAATTNIISTEGIGNLTIDGGLGVTATTSIGAVTIGGTTGPAGAINVTSIAAAANNVSVNGGTTVNVTLTGATGATTTIGNITKPTGAVTVSATTGTANTNAIGTITVDGGTTVTVTEAAGNTGALGNNTVLGQVDVNGSALTTAVTVNQATPAVGADAVLAVAGVATTYLPVAGALGTGVGVTAAPGLTGVSAITTVAKVAAAAAVVGTADGLVQIVDASYNTATANTIATVSLNNYAATSYIHDNALTTLNLKGVGGTLAIGSLGAPTPITTLALNLDTLSGTNTITDTGNEITTLNVTTANGNSTLAAFADTGLTTLNVAGTKKLTLSAINGSLTALNVSGGASFNDGGTTALNGLAARAGALTITNSSTGTFTASISDTTQTYTATGAGTSVITVNALADATKTIAAGAGTADELVLEGGAYALTSLSTGKFTGFETVGIKANVTGTIDMSVLDATASGLDIQGASTATFTKVATGAAVTLAAAASTTTVKYVDANGVNDTTTVTLAGTGVTSLTLQDANNVGVGTVNLVTNNAAFNTANVLTTLVDNGLATLNVSGTGGLTITTLNEATTQATAFTLNNTETNAAPVTITAFTDNMLGSLTFKGTNASIITNLVDTGAVLSISNTGTSTAGIGTLTDNTMTSLTLGANVALGQDATATTTTGLQDSSAAGVTVAGGSDNSHVTVNLTAGAGAGNTDSITLGNANNLVIDASTAGTVSVTVGTGSNLIDVHLAGNNATFSAAITLGAHSVATGIDSIKVGAAGTNFATVPNYVITGAVTGDTITFTNAVGTVVTTAQFAEATSVAHGLGVAELACLASGTASFTYGGNTYVVNEAALNTGAVTTDVIELVGLHTLSSNVAGVTTLLT